VAVVIGRGEIVAVMCSVAVHTVHIYMYFCFYCSMPLLSEKWWLLRPVH